MWNIPSLLSWPFNILIFVLYILFFYKLLRITYKYNKWEDFTVHFNRHKINTDKARLPRIYNIYWITCIILLLLLIVITVYVLWIK